MVGVAVGRGQAVRRRADRPGRAGRPARGDRPLAAVPRLRRDRPARALHPPRARRARTRPGCASTPASPSPRSAASDPPSRRDPLAGRAVETPRRSTVSEVRDPISVGGARAGRAGSRPRCRPARGRPAGRRSWPGSAAPWRRGRARRRSAAGRGAAARRRRGGGVAQPVGAVGVRRCPARVVRRQVLDLRRPCRRRRVAPASAAAVAAPRRRPARSRPTLSCRQVTNCCSSLSRCPR